MGITGLLPFIDKASRRANVSEFSGCSVAIDSYCWLHKGAFACADKLVRGEDTDIHIKYCLKYVTMLLSRNIKPILVFDGRHLPAKAMTEAKRRESRDISKKRAAELLSLGKIDEARSHMRRGVDITHAMALALIKECRKRNVDCIVAPYEADSQLAYLNIKNIAQLVITEDSDLILFGCTKVLFKMDLDGAGTLVDATRLPLVMRCPIERYTFDKFRHMCILSGCDYLPSLPGIGLAKARQFIVATQDSNIANALKKLPGFLNKSQLVVSDEYRESFLQAEATFKHQYVYDPLTRQMVRLTATDDDDTEVGLCCNAGKMLSPDVAFQLALGNLDPFTLKKMDDWSPDHINPTLNNNVKTSSWKEAKVSTHPSMWSEEFKKHLKESCPWKKKAPKQEEPIIGVPTTRPRKHVVKLVSRYVPETQDESLTMESLTKMYCVEPATKKQKTKEEDSQRSLSEHNVALTEEDIASELTLPHPKSPILKSNTHCFRKPLNITGGSILKRLSSFPRTVLENGLVESKFFKTPSADDITNLDNANITVIEDSQNDDLIGRISPILRQNDDPIGQISPVLQQNDDPIGRISSIIRQNDDPIGQISFVLQQNDDPIGRISPILRSKINRNPFKVRQADMCSSETEKENSDESGVELKGESDESQTHSSSQKENSPVNSPAKRSPILNCSPRTRDLLRMSGADGIRERELSADSVIENTYPLDSVVSSFDLQESFGRPSSIALNGQWRSKYDKVGGPEAKCMPTVAAISKKSNCKVSGLKKTSKMTLPSNQPTLLGKFGFQKRPIMKR